MDIAIPFGLSWGTKCMQDTTKAIAAIMHGEKYSVMNYINDLGGTEA